MKKEPSHVVIGTCHNLWRTACIAKSFIAFNPSLLYSIKKHLSTQPSAPSSSFLRLSLLVPSGHFPSATSGMASKASAHGLVQLLNTTAAAPTAPSSTTLRATSTSHQSNLKRLKQQQGPRIGLTPKHTRKKRERTLQRSGRPVKRLAMQKHILEPAPTKSRRSKKRPTTALCDVACTDAAAQKIHNDIPRRIWWLTTGRGSWCEPCGKRFQIPFRPLAEICSAASLSFGPGLLDAIQAAGPPAVSFFQNTPTHGRRRWGVYCLVLETPGHIPLIYPSDLAAHEKRPCHMKIVGSMSRFLYLVIWYVEGRGRAISWFAVYLCFVYRCVSRQYNSQLATMVWTMKSPAYI